MPYSLMSLISNIGEYYIPGHLYNFTIDVSGSGIDKFGFQTCFENEEGQKVGEIIIADSIQTQLISSGNYITHTSNGMMVIGSKSWDFLLEGNCSRRNISLYISIIVR